MSLTIISPQQRSASFKVHVGEGIASIGGATWKLRVTAKGIRATRTRSGVVIYTAPRSVSSA